MRIGARGRGLTPLFGYLLHRRGHKPSAWKEGRDTALGMWWWSRMIDVRMRSRHSDVSDKTSRVSVGRCYTGILWYRMS
jgi:hypothetical protein